VPFAPLKLTCQRVRSLLGSTTFMSWVFFWMASNYFWSLLLMRCAILIYINSLLNIVINTCNQILHSQSYSLVFNAEIVSLSVISYIGFGRTAKVKAGRIDIIISLCCSSRLPPTCLLRYCCSATSSVSSTSENYLLINSWFYFIAPTVQICC